MRRARPGAAPRGTRATTHARRSAGEQRALSSVDAGPDFERTADLGARDDLTPADESLGKEHESGEDAAPHGDERTVSRLWHITLCVSGAEAPLKEVRRGLEQLAHDHPFLLTSRYADDHAEIRYWEEARDLHDAAAVALRLWGEHRSSARLPPWEIVGLEVIDRETYHQRIAEGYGPPPATPVGVHPF
ncbi:hypothetical protein [Streptomyces wuyuanensis]|uniref:Uncharacterized protein n=1 Tax=Streptomyces wuyuanensis TaxID=1196353 RepID=A0A1G9SH06_9ACTN|nr:hypothetical protein [Streptomyces wuyuanensis]SDM34610.1 hypothetical protein SAMN05444921_10723 [Streptomyces wuyuanensis]